MKLNAFGKKIELVEENGAWEIYELGEGKKRRSTDFVIPSHYTQEEALTYLADILHEMATPENPEIIILD